MVDMDFSGPWGTTDENATPFFQPQVRLAWGGWSGDGIVDRGISASPGAITADGSDTTVTVRAFTAVIRGETVTLAADTDLDVEDAGGTTPTGGQTRIDRIVVHLDFAAMTATLIVSPGTPATSGAVAAALVQEDELDGIWEHEIGQVRRVGNVAVTNAMVTNTGQVLQAPSIYVPPGGTVPAKLARGTVVFSDTDIRVRRRTDPNTYGSLADKSILDPGWTPANLSGSVWEILASGRTFQFRFVGGVVQITGEAHKKTSTGVIPTTGWSTVCQIPVASLPGVAAGTYTHVSAHDSGGPLSWQLVVPTSGSASLQVHSVTATNAQTAGLSIFPIPVGA